MGGGNKPFPTMNMEQWTSEAIGLQMNRIAFASDLNIDVL